MKQIRLLLTLILCWASISGNCQSLEYIKSLIRNGQYLEAAKQLRPLAEAGNAEAQYWAACLFFDGKGVQKNDEQAIKYSTMSADQEFKPSIHILVNYYETRDAHKYVNTLQKYIAKYPYLSDDIYGCKLGYAIVSGYGTERDEDKGWKIIDSSKYCQDYIVEKNLKEDYYLFKAKEAGASCLEDYADY
ncbi:MAG: sel1 repeat family protein [Prevotella sp.]|nr:sel1 repeat family protein [Prevotella sp.]